MDIKDKISRCLQYIENHLYDKINLDDIAAHCDISKFHLHRMFKALSGEPLMEYIQFRKLSASLSALTNTNRRIIDIAMDYGFDYEQSYIRAFRKKFGVTPLKVRQEPVSLAIQEKLNINDIMSVNNSVVYKPSFMFKEPFYLVGTKYKIMSKSGDRVANQYGREFFTGSDIRSLTRLIQIPILGIRTGVITAIFTICRPCKSKIFHIFLIKCTGFLYLLTNTYFFVL